MSIKETGKMMKQITIEPITHKGENRIKLIFPYDDVLPGMVKNIFCIRFIPMGTVCQPVVWGHFIEVIKAGLYCDYPTLFVNNHHRL
jgi:hypothetical protein